MSVACKRGQNMSVECKRGQNTCQLHVRGGKTCQLHVRGGKTYLSDVGGVGMKVCMIFWIKRDSFVSDTQHAHNKHMTHT